MKLTNRTIRDAVFALNKLDAYSFKNGRTVYNLAKQMRLLKEAIAPFDEALKKLAADTFKPGETEIDKSDPRVIAFTKSTEDILAMEVELAQVHQVSLTDLVEARTKDGSGNFQQTGVPISVIDTLHFMIKDDFEP